jgi:dUTP pyrophosphatase
LSGDRSDADPVRSAAPGRPSLRIEIAREPGAGDIPLPSRATSGSSGYDLHAAVKSDVVIASGDRVLIPTGFSIAVPRGYEAQVRPRSGLAYEHGIILPNAPGTIDADYRGEIMVIVMNAGEKAFRVRRGDRIAQLVIAPVVTAEWDEVPALEATERGAGGFGHTGRSAADAASGSPEEGA